MRVAPIGVYFAGKRGWEVEEADMAGAEAAAVTHGHELGYIPSAALGYDTIPDYYLDKLEKVHTAKRLQPG